MAFKAWSPVNETADSIKAQLVSEFDSCIKMGGLDAAHAVSSAAYKLITLENPVGSDASLVWNSYALDKVAYVQSCLWRVSYLMMQEHRIIVNLAVGCDNATLKETYENGGIIFLDEIDKEAMQ